MAWRQPAGNGCSWRLATEADRSALDAHWDAQAARLGEQDRPDLFRNPVLIALVLEDDGTKVVRGGIYGEITVEMGTIGITRELSEAIPAAVPHLHVFFKERSIRVVRACVPRRLARLMEPLVAKFNMQNLSRSLCLFGYVVQKVV